MCERPVSNGCETPSMNLGPVNHAESFLADVFLLGVHITNLTGSKSIKLESEMLKMYTNERRHNYSKNRVNSDALVPAVLLSTPATFSNCCRSLNTKGYYFNTPVDIQFPY